MLVLAGLIGRWVSFFTTKDAEDPESKPDFPQLEARCVVGMQGPCPASIGFLPLCSLWTPW